MKKIFHLFWYGLNDQIGCWILILPLTENVSRGEALSKLAEQEFSRARQIDAQQDSPNRLEVFHWLMWGNNGENISGLKLPLLPVKCRPICWGRGIELTRMVRFSLMSFIQPTGGVTRRAGLRYLDKVSAQGVDYFPLAE